MLATPMVARFQSSAASSSATETLKLVRSRSFKLRTTWRLSLIDCAASMWSSRVRNAMGIQFRVSASSFAQSQKLPAAQITRNLKLETGNSKLLNHCFRGDPLRGECLDHVAGFDIAIVRDRDAALHAIGDFLGVVLEAPQRSDLALEHDYVVAQ